MNSAAPPMAPKVPANNRPKRRRRGCRLLLFSAVAAALALSARTAAIAAESFRGVHLVSLALTVAFGDTSTLSETHSTSRTGELPSERIDEKNSAVNELKTVPPVPTQIGKKKPKQLVKVRSSITADLNKNSKCHQKAKEPVTYGSKTNEIVKCIRKGRLRPHKKANPRHRNGLGITTSLELEYQALSRLAAACTMEELRHFPSVVDYEKGQYLIQTSLGKTNFERFCSSTTGEYPMCDPITGYPTYSTSELEHHIANDTAIITESDARNQIQSMLRCMEAASAWHMDYVCKNVAMALKEEEEEEENGGDGAATRATGRKKLRIGIIDFDLVHMPGYEDVNTERYFYTYNVTDWELLGCSLATWFCCLLY
mmetsp:Transcript_6639/g.14587  ORF Transcript_6639/g.14587 Transcript_6639/m.14587 type:complete len:370 (-) Transcript_6639:17-1126(-)